MFDLPPGPELARRNRRILAARSSWPDGALATCEQLDREHPHWCVWWMPANPIRGWEHPAGYRATRDDLSLPGGDEMRRHPEDGVSRHPSVFGATVAELLVRIAAMERRIARKATLDDLVWRSLMGRG